MSTSFVGLHEFKLGCSIVDDQKIDIAGSAEFECGTCANSCPYQNIRMVNIREESGKPLVDLQTQKPVQKATKCDFCVEQNGGPACQRACPHDALYRIDLTTPSTLYQLTQQ